LFAVIIYDKSNKYSVMQLCIGYWVLSS